MKPANLEDVYVLSPMQKGMLFHWLLEPDSTMYCNQTTVTLTGVLDPVAFRRAWERVVARHTVLRTSFFWQGVEEPVQAVHRDVGLRLVERDWRDAEPKRRRVLVDEFAEADRRRPFSLSTPPLMRLALLRLEDDEHVFVWSRHHIVLDGWSYVHVFREALTLYELYARLGDEPFDERDFLPDNPPYRRYIHWLRSCDVAGGERFWRGLLRGFERPTPLARGWRSPDSSAGPAEVAEVSHALSTALTDAIQEAGARHGLTFGTLVQGAWAFVLGHNAETSDVVYGCTVSGRPSALPGVEDMVGLFINTLPVRVTIAPEQRLVEWLVQLQSRLLDLRQHDFTPLVDIQGWSDVPRGLPLFESVTVVGNYPADALPGSHTTSLRLTRLRLHVRNNFPLTVRGIPGRRATLQILYDSRRLDRGSMEQALAHMASFLAAVADDPDVTLGDLRTAISAAQEAFLRARSSSRLRSARRDPAAIGGDRDDVG